jgi:hypothetical protein
MPGYWITPDDEGTGGTFKPGWKDGPSERDRGRPKPSGHPTPAPEPEPMVIDQRTVIAALAMAANYRSGPPENVLSTEGLTNESVDRYFNERMPQWIEHLEYEGLIKPYQFWIGGMARSGIVKVNPLYFFFVPATGRYGIGAKQSVSGSTNMLNSGFPTSVCLGVEGGFSTAQQDQLNGSTEMTYNINFGYGSLSYVPDKSLSLSVEYCVGRPSVGYSVGVKTTRGFSQSLNRPRIEPQQPGQGLKLGPIK